MNRNPNKHKHKARRKAEERRITTSRRNTDKRISQWLKDWYESRPDYPTSVQGEKRKRISWVKEFRRLLRKPKQK